MDNVKIISGRGNLELAHSISKNLNLPLTKIKLEDFQNSEIRVEIEESVRGFDVFVIQSCSKNENHSVNDFIMETCAIIRACKLSSAKSIAVILPYFPYSRSDKKDHPRVPIMGSFVSEMLVTAGANRIISLDLHAGQIQGFTNLPFDNIYCKKIFINHLKKVLFVGLSDENIKEKYVLASPDVGGAKRVDAYAKTMGLNHVLLHKQRDYSKSSVVLNSTLIGDKDMIKDKTVILIDDMLDTLGTMVSASNELIKYGAKEIILLATHGIFSGPAFDNLLKTNVIKKIYVINTLPQDKNMQKCNLIEVVDCSEILSKVIYILCNRGSISELFE